jgi:hypothetical protein
MSNKIAYLELHFTDLSGNELAVMQPDAPTPL